MKLLSAALTTLSVFCAMQAPAMAGPQHDKMRGCHMEIRDQGLSGDARQAYLKNCLQKEYQLKAATVEKIEGCKGQAEEQSLQGEEYKKFLRSCLRS